MSEHWETVSGIPLQPSYGPDDVASLDAEALASRPGSPPFLRGAYPEMYRARPWRIFQLSGHGNPEDERERIKFLLDQGETGFIMEHDRNTADHMYDPDHPEVRERHVVPECRAYLVATSRQSASRRPDQIRPAARCGN